MILLDLIKILYIIPGVLLGLSLHEFAHAQTAVWLGDDTPKLQGRLSISPLVHLDILGFLMILIAGFGWAKPVEINPYNFKKPKRDDILVSLAGPLANLLIAIFFILLMKILYYIPETILSDSLYHTIITIFDYTVWINIVLLVFNLLPIPPLDGSHIFFGLLGLKDKPFYYQFYDKSRFILFILIITNFIDKIIGPPIFIIYSSLEGLFF
ncbi:site-2 protease family protein [Caminicella sporogenes]|nr:site-2 protease family protein [Caminicella sporogenes]WIF93959.1 site-2 protease family protein [Caminicella sporogenes]